MIIYCDSSALVKLVIDEPESAELEAWLGSQPEPVLVSSVLARTEVVRAVARTDPDAARFAVEMLAAVSIVELDESLADDAARLATHGAKLTVAWPSATRSSPVAQRRGS